MNSRNKKNILFIIITLILIETSSLFLMYKSYSLKPIKLDEVNLNDSNDMFAIMLEQSDGTYKESSSKIWPGIGYNYNKYKSGCINELGVKLEEILDFRHGENIATVEAGDTVYCYLYFDKLTDDVTVNIDSVDEKIHYLGNYNRSVYCDNANVVFNEMYNRLEIANVNNPTNCTLFFDEPTNTYPTLISVIQDAHEYTMIANGKCTIGSVQSSNTTYYDCQAAGGRWAKALSFDGERNGICSNKSIATKTECEASGAYWWGVFSPKNETDNINLIQDFELRYQGLHPDNYIWFNNEMWRIIGYLPTKDASSTATNLVKIIRNDSIGGHSLKSTTWISSSVYQLLNNYYYKKEDGTKSGNCYSYSTTVTTNCDYRANGLNEIAQSMVVPVQWGIPTRTSTSTAATHFTSDSGTWTNVEGGINVGLMNTSDYGYGVLAADCARSKNLSAYNTAKFSGKNWLYIGVYSHIIGRYDGSKTWRTDKTGKMASTGVANVGDVRPVVYLNENVYVTKGDGSITNPYIIGMQVENHEE